MMLNRNNYSSTNQKSYAGSIFLIIIVFAIVIFGSREYIKQGLKSFLDIQVANKEEVQQIVKDFVMENPNLIISSLQEFQKKEEQDMVKKSQQMILDNKDSLQSKNEEFSLVVGNENGDVVVTSFLDYRCGYCKSANREIGDVISKDKNVKVIFKEFPILGPQSTNLAKLALAVYLIDKSKYYPFHNELMSAPNLDEKTLDAIYTKLSLDKAKVLELSESDKVKKELESVVTLANKIGIRGTPAFIIGDELLPGAANSKVLLEKISQQRK